MKQGCLLFIILGSMSWAAPIPTTSTSRVTQPQWGIYRSIYGFELDARNSNFTVSESPEDNENILALFKSKKNSEANFTVRVDESKNSPNLKNYMKKWPNLYQRLGFEILSENATELNHQDVHLVDLYSKAQKRQTRQWILFRKPYAVILTCSDVSANFQATANDCFKVFKSFKWNNSTQLGL